VDSRPVRWCARSYQLLDTGELERVSATADLWPWLSPLPDRHLLTEGFTNERSDGRGVLRTSQPEAYRHVRRREQRPRSLTAITASVRAGLVGPGVLAPAVSDGLGLSTGGLGVG
jgi:hypothetical protein